MEMKRGRGEMVKANVGKEFLKHHVKKSPWRLAELLAGNLLGVAIPGEEEGVQFSLM